MKNRDAGILPLVTKKLGIWGKIQCISHTKQTLLQTKFYKTRPPKKAKFSVEKPIPQQHSGGLKGMSMSSKCLSKQKMADWACK